MVKATNKAKLESIGKVGPVIIDFTPPQYDSDFSLDIGDVITLSWAARMFYDDEDMNILTEYEWALGKYKAFTN
jgi:hypothetical protein